MNEGQKELLTEGIKEVLGWVEATGDFAAEQAPLVVNEVIRWGLVTSLYDVIIGLMFLILTWKIFQYAHTPVTWKHWSTGKDARTASRFSKWSSDGNEEICVAVSVIGIIACILGPVFFLGGISYGLKVLIAPRLFILSQLQKLM